MWALRVLTGPQSGQTFPLKPGRNVLGRFQTCDIRLSSAGVSKEHSEVTVYDEKIIVTDLKSANGTSINGVRIQTGALRMGDKLGVHDILCDVIPHRPQQQTSTNVPSTQIRQQAPAQFNPHQQQGYPQQGFPQAQAYPQAQGFPQSSGFPQPTATPAFQSQSLKDKFDDFIDKNLMPAIIRLPEAFEYKVVLMGFVVLFIVATTLLSMIPMVQITRQSILSESKRRALTIAKTMATINQTPLLTNQFSGLNVSAGETEEGVTTVLIVQPSDGMVLAPASKAGQIPDLPFVHKARRENRQMTYDVDMTTVGASVPIGNYDAATGEQAVKAYAIVLYDISSLAFDDGQAISLFMQTLIIAGIIGTLIFFVMFKLIEFPIQELNRKLDIAIRERQESTDFNFSFPALQALISNINSLLSRYVSGDGSGGGSGSKGGSSSNRDYEAANIVNMMTLPAIAISKDHRVIFFNERFTQITNLDLGSLSGQSVQSIPDGSLQQNLMDLINKATADYGNVHTDQLDFSGRSCLLSCQSIGGSDITYFVITVSPIEGGG